MKVFDMDAMIRDKEELRAKLASLPFVDKLRLLDVMRERAILFANAIPSSPPTASREPNISYEPKKKL